MIINSNSIMESNTMIWFRKGLRIHDNPALDQARRGCKHLYPVFVLDPHYLDPDQTAFSPGSARSGLNRIQFLLESLRDLDASLRRLGSRLLLLRGEPAPVVCRLLKDWKIGKLCFEFDTEPYALARDKQVKDFSSKYGIEVHSPVSHTLFNPSDIIGKNGGRPPLTYQSFIALAGRPVDPLTTKYSLLPPIGETGDHELLSVPKIEDLGYGDISQEEFSSFHGGETEALNRLDQVLADKAWVVQFEKPAGDPSAFLKPATTVLSPYLKFGCLSSRYFYKRLDDIYTSVGKHTKPPVSLVGQVRFKFGFICGSDNSTRYGAGLVGMDHVKEQVLGLAMSQLLWRDFFYTVAFATPNFDRMKGNKICKQIPWRENEDLFVAWRDGRTGFPWIDAIMFQLKKWGWIHHLARHSVACFLTRGDLFIHWEKGRDVFERLLIDSDWAVNNGNWLWLSCSSFFYQYFRIYSPISFGKKYDPNGNYIRHFLPVLKDFPKEYIYEPWTAPLSVQKKANCIIGRDYPKPVVNHEIASKECKKKMGEAIASPTSKVIPQDQKASSSSRKKQYRNDSHEIASLKIKQRKNMK